VATRLGGKLSFERGTRQQTVKVTLGH